MSRQTPADLADEILAEGGPWSLDGARFQPPDASKAGYGVSIAFSGGAFWSEVALDSHPPSRARRAAKGLNRSGYEILGARTKPFHARRRLRGLRELNAEVRHLLALSLDRAAVDSFPSRASRRPGLPAGLGPFSLAAFNRMRHSHLWTLEWVSVCRRGWVTFVEAPTWSTGAWCSFLDGRGERWMDLGVQLFKRGPRRPASADAFARLLRAAVSTLAPLGYRPVKLQELRKRLFAVFEKRVDTLSIARRERTRLDAVLFGD